VLDATLSNYATNNGVYLNGNAGGWMQIAGDGTRASNLRIGGGASGIFDFTYASAAVARLTTNLLIGTTTDIAGTGGLHVAGTGTASTTTSGALRVGSNVGLSGNSGGASYFGGYIYAGDGSADARIIVQTNNPYALAVNRGGSGNGRFHLGATAVASPSLVFSNNAGTEVASLTGAGALTVSGTGTFGGAVAINTTSGLSVTGAGTQLATFESSVNGAVVELMTKGKNSVGTARQANMGINRFADDVWSLSNGTTEHLRVSLSTGAATFAGAVTIAGTVIHTLSATPASASATGTVGTMSWDANYIYICTAANTWKRVAIATW
jgi:hypothetical protein